MSIKADKRCIQCNYTERTKIAPDGARAYVLLTNPGNGHDRVYIVVRSHGGRWIEKWENVGRLTNFRAKTLPPEHPLYGRAHTTGADAERTAVELQTAHDTAHDRQDNQS